MKDVNATLNREHLRVLTQYLTTHHRPGSIESRHQSAVRELELHLTDVARGHRHDVSPADLALLDSIVAEVQGAETSERFTDLLLTDDARLSIVQSLQQLRDLAALHTSGS